MTRTLRIEDTLANQVEVLDDGTTIADIFSALGWVKREKERSRAKAKRTYEPTGNKPGRPKGWKKGVNFGIKPPAENKGENLPAEA